MATAVASIAQHFSLISTSSIDRDRGQFDCSPMQSDIKRISVAVAVSIAVTACGGIPIGYDRIEDSTDYVTPETLSVIETQHLTRDEVIEILGPPVADSPEYRALGFQKCAAFSGKELQFLFVLVWPTSGPEYTNRDCQKIGVWFDDTGRAFRAVSRTYLEANTACALDEWLHKPGGSCW